MGAVSQPGYQSAKPHQSCHKGCLKRKLTFWFIALGFNEGGRKEGWRTRAASHGCSDGLCGICPAPRSELCPPSLRPVPTRTPGVKVTLWA